MESGSLFQQDGRPVKGVMGTLCLFGQALRHARAVMEEL